MLMLRFENWEDIQKTDEFNNVRGLKILIKPFLKMKLWLQCKIYQEYGHTQGYWGKKLRFVKCKDL